MNPASNKTHISIDLASVPANLRWKVAEVISAAEYSGWGEVATGRQTYQELEDDSEDYGEDEAFFDSFEETIREKASNLVERLAELRDVVESHDIFEPATRKQLEQDLVKLSKQADEYDEKFFVESWRNVDREKF